MIVIMDYEELNSKLGLCKDVKWMPVYGYIGYLISTDGNYVYGIKSKTLKTFNYRDKKRYYPRVMMPGGLTDVHRLVYASFHGGIPEGYEIDHLNRIKDDNRIENLEAVTKEENLKRQHAALKAGDLQGVRTKKEKDFIIGIVRLDSEGKGCEFFDSIFEAIKKYGGRYPSFIQHFRRKRNTASGHRWKAFYAGRLPDNFDPMEARFTYYNWPGKPHGEPLNGKDIFT